MMMAVAVVALVAVAAPALAQTTPPAGQPPVQPKEQGLGIFVQGGWVRSSTFSASGAPDMQSLDPQGGIFGIGFGGNKSGAFGVGVDLNYMVKTASDVRFIDIPNLIFEDGDLNTQILDIPVYGRFNIGGHRTKNAPTFFIPFGWFFDILVKSDINGVDIKDAFNGFQTGRSSWRLRGLTDGIEARGQWALETCRKRTAARS
jgi:hypothetical protein